MSKFYLNKFQRIIFSFLWGSNSEPLSRHTLYLDKLSGGLNICNIDLKLKALRLKHLQDIINSKDVKFIYFSIYWVGLTLRHYNKDLYSLLSPHSDVVPSFYRTCLDSLKLFKDKCESDDNDDSDLIVRYTTKMFYSVLLSDSSYHIKIVERYPLVEFKPVFKRVFNSFLDKYSRDVMFRIVHEILPVGSYLFRYNISRDEKCVFCKSVETMSHLFVDCSVVKHLFTLLKNWIFSLSNSTVTLSFKHICFQDLDTVSSKPRDVILLLISMYCNTVWSNRNLYKFKGKAVSAEGIYVNFLYRLKSRIVADFTRFPRLKFNEYWCDTDLFCKVDDVTDELIVNFI